MKLDSGWLCGAFSASLLEMPFGAMKGIAAFRAAVRVKNGLERREGVVRLGVAG